MFERSLSSLIKGLRSHRGKDEPRYVATLMEEIKHEIRSGDMDVKAEAVLKLTYLQMLGYAPSNASFHMLEVMASPRLHLKQVGYLAASQCFDQDTEVLILATNMIKKDLRSPSSYDVATALNGLSHIITPDLAKHLASDVIALLTHTKPSIRKRALLVLHSIILQYPPALEQSLTRLSEKLDDSETGVISSAVNIICELARRDQALAKAFLPLSPQLFHLLTSSTNNWMLIKIVKLFGVLTPLEPRLAKRLLPPITTIIRTTPAMSLLYECIHTVIIGGMLEGTGGDDLAEICSEKLGTFLDDDDQNLRYIALLALVKILPTHPHLVAIHKESIFESMDDEDLSIRMRALDLVSGMASRNNFVDIVNQQMLHLEPSSKPVQAQSASQALRQAMKGNGAKTVLEPSSSWISASYRDEIINKILDVGSTETYTNIVDFEWYVDILIRLNYLAGDSVGHRIQWQLIDISSRVRAVRPHAIEEMKKVLENQNFITASDKGERSEGGLQIFRAAAWICGEYGQHIAYPPVVINLLLQKELAQACDEETQAMLVHSAIKLFAWWLLEQGKQWSLVRLADVKKMTNELVEGLNAFRENESADLHERLTEFSLLLSVLQNDLQKHDAEEKTQEKVATDSDAEPNEKEALKAPKSLQLLSPLFFGHALGPVSRKAQSKVAIPAGLDLTSSLTESIGEDGLHIVDEWSIEDAAQKAAAKQASASRTSKKKVGASTSSVALEAQERKRLRLEREKRERESPFYLRKGDRASAREAQTKDDGNLLDDEDDIDAIPIVQLQLDDVLHGDKKQAKEEPSPPQQEKEEEPQDADEPSNESQVVRKAVSKKKRRAKAVDVSEKNLVPSKADE